MGDEKGEKGETRSVAQPPSFWFVPCPLCLLCLAISSGLSHLHRSLRSDLSLYRSASYITCDVFHHSPLCPSVDHHRILYLFGLLHLFVRGLLSLLLPQTRSLGYLLSKSQFSTKDIKYIIDVLPGRLDPRHI